MHVIVIFKAIHYDKVITLVVSTSPVTLVASC